MALTLKYWKGRGVMEIPRVVLAIAGKFPGDGYNDERFDRQPDGLDANLGRMPVAVIGDVTIGQSVAIAFYVATENGLMGENSIEAAQILAINEHARELYLAYEKLCPYGEDPTKEALDNWFDGGAQDVSGTADWNGRPNRHLTWWMGRLENALGNQGFAVGNKISLADVVLHNVLAEVLTKEEASNKKEWWRFEPFTDMARVEAKLDKHPKLKASIDAVRNHPNFQKWLATRGPQGF